MKGLSFGPGYGGVSEISCIIRVRSCRRGWTSGKEKGIGGEGRHAIHHTLNAFYPFYHPVIQFLYIIQLGLCDQFLFGVLKNFKNKL